MTKPFHSGTDVPAPQLSTAGKRARLAELVDESVAILAAADAERRELTAEERDKIDANAGAFDRIDEEITLAERLSAQGEKIARGAGRVTDPRSVLPLDAEVSGVRTVPRAGPRRFDDLFARTPDPYGFSWKRGEFMRAVAKGLHHPAFNSVMTTGVGADGGFTVPTPLAREWLDAALAMENIRPRARVVAMTSSSLSVASPDSHDRSSGEAAGIGLEWLAEAAPGTEQKVRFRTIKLTAHKGAAFAEISSELSEDGLGIEEALRDAFAGSVAMGLDHGFISGSGVGQPLGLRVAGCTITVAAEGGQSADTITLPNVSKMMARLHPSCMNSSVWLAHPSTLPQLLQLQSVAMDSGTPFAATPVTVQQPDGSLRLLTRPVLITDQMQPLGDLGDIMLVDPSRYIVGMRRDMRIERSLAPGWSTDTISFRLTLRTDGQPAWAAAVTPRYGSDTLSCFIQLAAR